MYYKRNDENKWKWPGTVIGQDGKIVFVRHSSIYVRVLPRRLIMCGTEFNVKGNKGTSNKEQNESDRLSKTRLVANESDSESGNKTENVHGPLNLEEEPEIDPVPILPEVQIQQNAEIVRPKEKQKIPSIGENLKYRAKDSDIWVKPKFLVKVAKLQGRTGRI